MNPTNARSQLNKRKMVIFGAGTGNPFFTTDTAASLRAETGPQTGQAATSLLYGALLHILQLKLRKVVTTTCRSVFATTTSIRRSAR